MLKEGNVYPFFSIVPKKKNKETSKQNIQSDESVCVCVRVSVAFMLYLLSVYVHLLFGIYVLSMD